MEITEKWIIKAAGWKATKEGRELHKQGAVIESKQKANIITGSLRSGAKPTRVTVKINSSTDVDTTCPRIQCRRTGEICSHAVAVILHTISTPPTDSNPPEKQPQQTSKNTPIPLRIDLPPTFPSSLNKGKGGISIKLSPSDNSSPTKSDHNLTDWLIENTNNPAPPLLGLKGIQALDFLNQLAGHQKTFIAGKPTSIHNNGNRIPMSLQRDDDRFNIQLSSHKTSDTTAWYTNDHLYLWDNNNHHLIIHNVTKLWKPRYWLRIADGYNVSIPIKEFLTSIEAQNDLIIWDNSETLSEIPISPATPSFTLILEGSTSLLSAQVQALYPSEPPHTIGIQDNCNIKFPIPNPNKEDHFLTRNKNAEEQAAASLMQAGFNITDPNGTWQMNSEDTIIEFLTATLPNLDKQQNWTIKTNNKLNSLKNNIVRITPSFDITNEQTQKSGQDWLAFDLNFKTDGGKEIPKEVIQRMLASGKRTGTSKNGKRVIISNFDANTIETVLRDTNPQQENGLYYTPKAQAAYLKRLQQHYSNQTPTKPDLNITKKLPQSIQSTLRPYQKEGIAWLHDRTTNEGAALLADDMGLGKTLQTLSLIHLIKSPTLPTLVVCPTSLLGNWQAECQKFFPQLNTLILHGPKRKKYFNIANTADIIITSYALIARDLEFYSKTELQTLVIDEASLIRNPDTQAAKALKKITATHRIALTGTPVENAIQDLWSLFHFLLPNYLGTRKEFQQNYQQPLSSSTPDPAIMKRLRMRVEPFMLRRTKTKVATDLPPKIHQTIYCEPTSSQKNTYQQLLKQGIQKTENTNANQPGQAHLQILTVLLRLRQAATDLRLLDPDMDISADEASSKITRLLELLIAAKQGNHRVLIFSQFTSMLSLIKSALINANITFAYLDGTTKDRSKEVEKFQSPNGPDTFLISLKAGGYGLNLTAADTVIHVDPWWNPAVEAQATDRAYRIGQTKPTTVYKLVTTGTVEEKILKLQETKQGLINATLADAESHTPLMQGLSQKEIAQLLTQ